MSAEIRAKRKETPYHLDELQPPKMQKTSVDHTPLFFTIYGELKAHEGRSSAKQIADLLVMNPDVLIPFQHSSIRRSAASSKTSQKLKNLENRQKKTHRHC